MLAQPPNALCGATRAVRSDAGCAERRGLCGATRAVRSDAGCADCRTVTRALPGGNACSQKFGHRPGYSGGDRSHSTRWRGIVSEKNALALSVGELGALAVLAV